MAENFLNRLARNPYAPIDGASITRVDELGNGYDDWNNLIAPKYEAPQQSWGELTLGLATAPARIATALAGSVSPYGQDGWQIPPIVNEGVNALTAVGDAYNYGMDQDEINNRALGMAGFIMGGGGPAAALERSMAQRPPVTVRGYHGTRSEFDKFNGPSVFASENPDAASEWAMVANRDGEAPNVLPLNITASNPYYAKSLFPDQAELDRIAAADPDVVFYPPSTQFDTTFDKYPGQVFEARKPGTVRSATTGEVLFSNSDSRPALAGLAGQEQKGITAYHGSPHDFDKFDMSKIGTGEGAQAYGHGLYFAENEGVAKSYRNALSPSVLSTADGAMQTIAANPSALSTSQAERVAASIKDAGGYDAAVSNAQRAIAEAGGGPLSGMRKALAEDQLRALEVYSGMNPEVKSAGHMYQVRINANPDDFLDWDSAVGKQAVKDKLSALPAPNAADPALQARLQEILRDDWSTGQEIVHALGSGAGDGGFMRPEISNALREAGIPGIKYLDQMSRNAGDGSRNYVVFDDSLIEILKKYGWLAPGAMYGENALNQPQTPSGY